MHSRSASAVMTPEDEVVERAALGLAEALAREAIDLAAGASTVVGRKAGALDLVTAADVAIEQHFRQRIAERFPSHAVLGEEQGLDGRGREWTWIVDPIDGTFNYATRFAGVGSSIALMHGDELRVGVIADLALGTVFACRKGAGMTWSGGSLSTDLEPAAAFGRARLLIDPGHLVPAPAVFSAIEAFAGLASVVPRMVGSAAVSLATVALAGGCFLGAGLEIWDAAAGMLLAEERGRTIRWWRFTGDPCHHVLAGERELVTAFEPLMPDFIEAWRSRSTANGALLGPSDTILLRHEDE
jgi:myo-inositol-1(or 4)-monophosphatase